MRASSGGNYYTSHRLIAVEYHNQIESDLDAWNAIYRDMLGEINRAAAARAAIFEPSVDMRFDLAPRWVESPSARGSGVEAPVDWRTNGF